MPDKGPNTIVTVATDSVGKAATDTRTVFNDSGPPLLDFLPENGTVTSELLIDIKGTASDDAGIESVLINGQLAVLTEAGPGAVSFSVPFAMELGGNFIEVVATDISNKSITVVREVVAVENQPPIADAGGPYEVDEGGSVTLAGSGIDPDGDPLTYEWEFDGDGLFDDAVGASASFSAAGMDGPSSVSIDLRVTDTFGFSSESTATVNILSAKYGGKQRAAQGGAEVYSLGSGRSARRPGARRREPTARRAGAPAPCPAERPAPPDRRGRRR